MWYPLSESSRGTESENNSSVHVVRAVEVYGTKGDGVRDGFRGPRDMKNGSSCVAEAQGRKERKRGCVAATGGMGPGCEGT